MPDVGVRRAGFHLATSGKPPRGRGGAGLENAEGPRHLYSQSRNPPASPVLVQGSRSWCPPPVLLSRRPSGRPPRCSDGSSRPSSLGIQWPPLPRTSPLSGACRSLEVVGGAPWWGVGPGHVGRQTPHPDLLEKPTSLSESGGTHDRPG